MTSEKRQIIALGGGGFSMETSPVLDDYILACTGKSRPKVCFVPTASGDADGYVAKFYQAFSGKDCESTHLELFRRGGSPLGELLRAQDVIYVGGGNTANMLSIWRLHGVEEILKAAYKSGVVLAGISAGAVCWFKAGTTDSFGPGLAPLTNGLGLLPGSVCPHYDGEANRRPRYHELIASGELPGGYAADDGVALHFVDGDFEKAVSSRANAKAYRIELRDGETSEVVLSTEFLGGMNAE